MSAGTTESAVFIASTRRGWYRRRRRIDLHPLPNLVLALGVAVAAGHLVERQPPSEAMVPSAASPASLTKVGRLDHLAAHELLRIDPELL